jgi:cytochrome P450 family 138
MRITLNAILRAVFGAEGAELDALRELMPKIVDLGSKLAFLPVIHHDLGRYSPWGRFVRLRREFDSIAASLIATAQADPQLTERADVLSLMLQARYDDGAAMTPSDIADELLARSRNHGYIAGVGDRAAASSPRRAGPTSRGGRCWRCRPVAGQHL